MRSNDESVPHSNSHTHDVKVNRDILIPIGIVVTMLGAAISFGITYEKVNQVADSTVENTRSLQQTREEVSALSAQRDEILRTLSDIKSDINAIRASQIKSTGR